jgi:hypothetical protein
MSSLEPSNPLRVVKQCKDLGNTAFKSQQYLQAAMNYTNGITLLPATTHNLSLDQEIPVLRFQLVMNRSKAFFYLQQYALAFTDIFGTPEIELKRPSDFVFASKVAAKCRQIECFELVRLGFLKNLANSSPTFVSEYRQEFSNDIEAFYKELQQIVQSTEKKEEKTHALSSSSTPPQQQEFVTRYQNATRQEFKYQPDFKLLHNLNSKKIQGAPFYRVNSMKFLEFKLIALHTLGLKIEETVTNNRSYGIFSVEPIAKDQMIVIQPPVVFSSLHPLDCEDCGQRFTEQSAVRCSHNYACQVRYCSSQCEKDAWFRYHQIMCENEWSYVEVKKHCRECGVTAFSRVPPVLMKLFAISLKKQLFSPLSMIELAQLMPLPLFSKSACIPLSIRMDQYHRFLESMRWNAQDQKRLDFMTFDYMYAILLNNCFQWDSSFSSEKRRQENEHSTGLVLYQFPSFFNHSCAPNTKWTLSSSPGGPKFILTASENIAANQELFISYVDVSKSKIDRNSGLQQYGFECNCSKCSNE